mmetsp:Transcript_12077/g.17967  ORF Transcript_12077/g.17967 Transcript_12077/m.17967 type:complete len:433 (-) Transcript_12077:8-1306(-)
MTTRTFTEAGLSDETNDSLASLTKKVKVNESFNIPERLISTDMFKNYQDLKALDDKLLSSIDNAFSLYRQYKTILPRKEENVEITLSQNKSSKHIKLYIKGVHVDSKGQQNDYFSQRLDGIEIELASKESSKPTFLDKRSPLLKWSNSQSPILTNGFSFDIPLEKLNNQPLKIKVILYTRHFNSYFHVSEELKEILNFSTSLKVLQERHDKLVDESLEQLQPKYTIDEILKSVWSYIKHNKLIDPDNNKKIILDDRLSAVVGDSASLHIHALLGILRQHCTLPNPFSINYVLYPNSSIVLNDDGSFIGDAVYSNSFSIVHALPTHLITNQDDGDESLSDSFKKSMQSYQSKIQDLCEKIYNHESKRQFMMEFALNPTLKMYRVLVDQTKILNNVYHESNTTQSTFWKLPWVNDAVAKFLNDYPVEDEGESIH